MLAKLLERARPAREAKATVAGWHPDFRDVRKLPDVKVVRTAFFINGALAVAAVLLGGTLAFREWQVREVAGKIAEEEAKIARDRPLSEAALKQYQAFREDHSRVEEVAAFVATRPSVPRLLRRLGETLPPDLALDGFELREDGLALRFTVRGDALAASGLATRYLETLRGDAAMGAFDQFTFAGTPARNATTGRVGVEFFLRLKSKGDEKAKAGRKKGMNLAGTIESLRSNLPGVALGGLVLLLGAVSFWRSDALDAAEKQWAAKQVLANRLGRNVKQAAQLPEQASALAAARQTVEARILRGAEIGPHAEFFYRLEREAGVKLTELRPQPTPPPPKGVAPRVIPVPFSLSLQGSWSQMLGFLELLEADDRYVRVQTMSVVANPTNRQESLSVTVAVELLGRP